MQKRTRLEKKVPSPAEKKKLSFKEQRELDELPARIEALEAEQRALNDRIAAPDFYKEEPSSIRDALARGEALQREVAQAYERWHALDSRSDQE